MLCAGSQGPSNCSFTLCLGLLPIPLSPPYPPPCASRNCLPKHLMALYPYLFLEEFNSRSSTNSQPSPPSCQPLAPLSKFLQIPAVNQSSCREAGCRDQRGLRIWENIGSNSMSFQKSSQVQHLLSPAITASFYAGFKCSCKQLFTLWPGAPLKDSF